MLKKTFERMNRCSERNHTETINDPHKDDDGLDHVIRRKQGGMERTQQWSWGRLMKDGPILFWKWLDCLIGGMNSSVG